MEEKIIKIVKKTTKCYQLNTSESNSMSTIELQ